MAKQFGAQKLIGTVGDVTYAQTKSGFTARSRSKINKVANLKNPKLQALRDHAAEFGRAAKASALIRNAFYPLVQQDSDKKLLQRLNSRMLDIVKSDPHNPRGERIASNGDLAKLIDFEFNAAAGRPGIFTAELETSCDRATGQVKVSIAAFEPRSALKVPHSATYFRLGIGAAAFSFETGETVKAFNLADYQPLAQATVPATSITVTLPAGTTWPVLIALKLSFGNEVNGDILPMFDPALTTCSILQVVR